jgi:branched-chain amino acid transport system ATP-binding protein
LLVEQNFRFAAPLADRHIVLEHGRIVATVTKEELPSKTDLLHELLGV